MLKRSTRRGVSDAWLLLLPLLCAAAGAQAAVGGVPLNTIPCVTSYPSAATCGSNVWLAQCATYYGIKTPPIDPNDPNNLLNDDPTCGPLLRASLTGYASKQAASSETLFDRSTDAFTASVPSAGWAPTKRVGTQQTWAAQEDKARFDASQAVISPGTQLSYTRPGIGLPTAPIDSCEQYTYRAFYELERWLDSTNACKGDPRCITNVSMNQLGMTGPSKMPGIARRALLNSENNKISEPKNSANRLNQLVTRGLLGQSDADAFDDDAYQLDNVPKNGFYAATKYFMVPKLVAAFDANGQQNLGALLDELARGEQLYVMGTGSPTQAGIWFTDAQGNPHQGFGDEWDFHRIMALRTKNTSAGESREYRRRQSELTAQYAKVMDGWKCLIPDKFIAGGCQGLGVINSLGKVNPGDIQMWEGDPLATRSLYSKLTPQQLVVSPFITGMVGFGADLQANLIGPLAGLTSAQLGALPTQLAQGGHFMVPHQAHLPGLLSTNARAIGTLQPMAQMDVIRAATNIIGELVPHVDPASLVGVRVIVAGDANAGYLIDRTWEINPPIVDTNSRTPRLLCDLSGRVGAGTEGGVLSSPVGALNLDALLHTERIWKDVCLMTNLLLAEWGRTLQGHASCIDKANSTCDWVPQDFVDRFVTRHVGFASAAKEVEYRTCKRWTAGGQFSSLNPNIGMSAAARANLSSVRKTIDDRESVFTALLKKVPVMAVDTFGTQRADSQTIGDSTFGGGYSYALGWHATVKQRTLASNDPYYPNNPGQICRLGGTASAKLGANAVLFGLKSTLLDGIALVSSNENNDGKAYGNAHLYVIGIELFDTKDMTSAPFNATPNGDINIAAQWSDGWSDGARPTLFAVPFQAGPITITITVGISYQYGYTTGFQAGGPPSDPSDPKSFCNPTAALYQTSAFFTPSAELGVWLDADASFLGFGVGLEVELQLVGLALPLTADVNLGIDNTNQLAINFHAQLDLDLSTLKGRMSVYVKGFFVKIFSVTLVDWDGFHHRFPIFSTPPVSLPISQLPASVQPFDPSGASETL